MATGGLVLLLLRLLRVVGAVVAGVLDVAFNEVTIGNRPGASVFGASADRRDPLGDRLDDDVARRDPGQP